VMDEGSDNDNKIDIGKKGWWILRERCRVLHIELLTLWVKQRNNDSLSSHICV
jgi:hypothetical protein